MIKNEVFKRSFLILIIFSIIYLAITSPIYAVDDIIESGKNFLSKGRSVESVIDTSQLKETSDYIFNILLVVAIIIAVGIGIILGIKFITSSVEEQAKIKEALVPYIVGCIVIFGAFPIWNFIVKSAEEASGTDENVENQIKLIHSGEENWGVCDHDAYVMKNNVHDDLYSYRQCDVCKSITMVEPITNKSWRLIWARCENCNKNLVHDANELFECGINKAFFARCFDCGHIGKYRIKVNADAVVLAKEYNVEKENYKILCEYRKSESGEVEKDAKESIYLFHSIENICSNIMRRVEPEQIYEYCGKNMTNIYKFTCPTCNITTEIYMESLQYVKIVAQ